MCLSPNKLVYFTVFSVKFFFYPSLSLNIVDVISMINTFLSNGKFLSIFELKWQEKLSNLRYFPVKKNEPKFSLVNFRLKIDGKAEIIFFISFLFYAKHIDFIVSRPSAAACEAHWLSPRSWENLHDGMPYTTTLFQTAFRSFKYQFFCTIGLETKRWCM